MSGWTDQELAQIGDTDEIDIAGRRLDGTLEPSRTIWIVRHGDCLFVRSVNGSEGGWFQGARVRNEGRIFAGDVERDVRFEDADHAIDDAIDEEYRRKYGASSSAVDHINDPKARATTLRVLPALDQT